MRLFIYITILNTILFEQNIIYEISADEISPFSIYTIMVDLRHISNYMNKFVYGNEWTLYL